jgi:putative transposase
MKKKYKFDRGQHSVYTLNYHLIICTKYRRKVLTNDKIIDDLKTRVKKIAEGFGVEILNQEVDKDHIHILFKATPTTNLMRFINSLKGSTSKAIRNRFPEVKKKLWKDVFWSQSYCLITTGQVTLDQLKKYVENQGGK